MIIVLGALMLVQPGMVTIRVSGREMIGLHNREDVFQGTCDGRRASVAITRASRDAPGRVVVRTRGWARDVPSTFLDGALLTGGLQFVGLSCDGRRLELHALDLHENGQGEFVMSIQNATLDMRTGILSVDEMRTLSPAETRSENAPRR